MESGMLREKFTNWRTRIRDNLRTQSVDPVDWLMAVEGQISRGEVETLIGLAADVETDAVIVEIGSYRGRSSCALGYGARLGYGPRVYAVDPHEVFTGMLGGEYGPADQAALYQNLTSHGLGNQVAVVSLPSIQVARGWPEQNIGLLWLDGDHSYAALSQDLKNWFPSVKPGGHIAFHDIGENSVAAVIAESEDRREFARLGSNGRMAWFEKLRTE